ncbi:proline hydroxylase [Pollutimonas nitritireducens]|uniref:Proline hydroxylase n=1 Tax=Pollutimonas nitritireducens TaxID=2045209 RepID=A0A2N4UHZ1_9BURK|nr:2OG-Fe(II) oxygenase [Pollutimonas nitritireducens]PLC54629.1 proline hydroxylase [Pollutimonas nitritireducens]
METAAVRRSSGFAVKSSIFPASLANLIAQSIGGQNWECVEQSLDETGNAVLSGLLTPQQCRDLTALYTQDDRFRTRIVMARHGFGRGEYKYFAYPLPGLIDALRSALYPHLFPIVNRWNEQLRIDVRYPDTLHAFLKRCHAAGQTRPTPLMLRYGKGDYNCLHQDLYGDHVFPLQVAILLSRPGDDFTGGEFVMIENNADHQRADVVPLQQGDGVVFAVNQRPVKGKRTGMRKVGMRHGVSRLHSGQRHTVGLIFHDAH